MVCLVCWDPSCCFCLYCTNCKYPTSVADNKDPISTPFHSLLAHLHKVLQTSRWCWLEIVHGVKTWCNYCFTTRLGWFTQLPKNARRMLNIHFDFFRWGSNRSDSSSLTLVTIWQNSLTWCQGSQLTNLEII